MMEQELQSTYDDLEDGELSTSSDEIYTPLSRPASLLVPAASSIADPQVSCSPHPPTTAIEEGAEEEDSQEESSTDSSGGSSSDACLKDLAAEGRRDGQQQRKRRKRVRRTVMVRIQPKEPQTQKRARFKKYNVWTAALQEEALTENMRGCDVTQNGCNDRNVENYDFSLRYRLNGENSLKRRLSNSTDDISDGGELANKRWRPTAHDEDSGGAQRRSVKSRLSHRPRGRRSRRGSSPTSGSDSASFEPRHIIDLEEVAGREPEDVAREIANKLYEEKDELMVRIVDVLGTELPIEIYKETQRIEAEGGMMIKNGHRRRTPGGVFLFLLKHNDRLTAEDQKSIFAEERQNTNKWRKNIKAKSRDRKVEELKKRLSEQEKELPALSTRKDIFLLGSDLSVENQAGNLSNPPPSPVGHEQSPDYKSHAINHVGPPPHTENIGTNSPEKPSTSASAFATSTAAEPKDLVSYDDDFLDVNCADMDFF